MGTTAEKPETPAGVIQRVGHRVAILRQDTSDAVYGRRGGSLYPLVLLLVAASALLVAGASALVPVGVAGLLALLLLALWVGGSGR